MCGKTPILLIFLFLFYISTVLFRTGGLYWTRQCDQRVCCFYNLTMCLPQCYLFDALNKLLKIPNDVERNYPAKSEKKSTKLLPHGAPHGVPAREPLARVRMGTFKTYFDSLPADTLMHILSLTNMQISLCAASSGCNPFELIVSQIIDTLIVDVSAESRIQKNEMFLGEALHIDTVENLLKLYGDSIRILKLHNLLHFSHSGKPRDHQTQKFFTVVSKYCSNLDTIAVSFDWDIIKLEDRESHLHMASYLSYCFGSKISSLCISSDVIFVIMVNNFTQHCTKLSRIILETDNLISELPYFWIKVGFTLKYLDAQNAYISPEIWLRLFNVLKQHCTNLTSLLIGKQMFGPEHAQQLTDLCIARSKKLEEITLGNLWVRNCEEIKDRCSSLNLCSIMDDINLKRVASLDSLITKLALTVHSVNGQGEDSHRNVFSNCLGLSELECICLSKTPSLISEIFSTSKDRLNRFIFFNRFSELSEEHVLLISTATKSLKELFLYVKDITTPAELYYIAKTNPELQKIFISINKQSSENDVEGTATINMSFAKNIGISFKNLLHLKTLQLENRREPNKEKYKLTGVLEKAFLPLDRRGTRLSIFGGYINKEISQEQAPFSSNKLASGYGPMFHH